VSRVSASYRKLFLRGILWDAAEAGIPLGQALQIACQSQLSETKSGKFLTGTSRSGHSVAFSLPMGGRGYSPEDITELCGELYDCFETAVGVLTWELDGTEVLDKDNNQAIYTQMVASCSGFTSIRRFGTDHSGMKEEPAYA
jgi:hypothetical protein